MKGTYIGLDLETTGLNPEKHQIIEVGLIKLVDGVITETYHSLVNPGTGLPLRIKRLTGIDDEMLADAPPIEEILPEIFEFIGDAPLLGHKVEFDRDFLSTFKYLDNPIYDTVELARIVLPTAPNHRLATLCELCLEGPFTQHRALDDAKASVLLALELVNRLKDFNNELLQDLTRLLKLAGSSWYTIFQQAAFDQFTLGSWGKMGGLKPLKGENLKNKVIKGDVSEHRVEEDEIEQYIGRGGAISKVLDRYEYRPQQIEMAQAVTKTMNEGGYLLAEAGTGTGKSMAYLLPAALYAKRNNQRVLISTHTINLQEQLWSNDLPLLQRMGIKVDAALVKGRGNYLCLRRWYAALRVENISAKEAAFFARLMVWLTMTETGDRSELNIPWYESELWKNLCAESAGCIGTRCRFFKNLCFSNRARRKADQADIIIANHSLVFSDIKADNKVLPQYSVLVMDEAHHLEDAAALHLGTTFTRADLLRWLADITKLTGRLNAAPPDDNRQWWVAKLAEIKVGQHRVKEAAQVFFDMLVQFLKLDLDAGKNEYRNLRLKEGKDLSHMAIEIENLTRRVNTLSGLLIQMAGEIEGQSVEGESDMAKEAALVGESGLALAADILYVCDSSSADTVNWVEGGISEKGMINMSIHAAPVEVGPLLHRTLYSEKDKIIFTSATLTVDRSFQYFIERSGLDLVQPELITGIQVESPFDYEKQSLFYVLNDVPMPGSCSEEEYINSLARVLTEMIIGTGGKMLVLFTAHRMLKEIYYRVKATIEEEDILLLGHEIDGSRSRLVEDFKESERAVIFGAASFWEGLDIPGDSLSLVVLVKLPFWPPSVPVIEARMEALERQNKNGFRCYNLPTAIIKFKQGFGRLIRTRYDKGVVVVLDRRIIGKAYGHQFLRSLPVASYLRDDLGGMLNKIKIWLNEVD
ncbi:helicase C-terminal domain-containing protein [Desulfofalx alkaliphila]|uniref:helicase C-terminal domain-containing protein n=1 Tax=Desulfofalx alkaliphila TaxID=105483 RepID=UPI00068CFA28|nr:helicase C-terminal domain-containing protein [Desulfofalx alkaliphila]